MINVCRKGAIVNLFVLLIRKHILWKAYGITASKGKDKIAIDVVVGEAKCITPDGNLDANGGEFCVCSVKSVSTGSFQKKWVYTDTKFGFYMGDCYNNKAGICEDTCAGRCAQDFASDDYNVRYGLMQFWKP